MCCCQIFQITLVLILKILMRRFNWWRKLVWSINLMGIWILFIPWIFWQRQTQSTQKNIWEKFTHLISNCLKRIWMQKCIIWTAWKCGSKWNVYSIEIVLTPYGNLSQECFLVVSYKMIRVNYVWEGTNKCKWWIILRIIIQWSCGLHQVWWWN